MNFPLMYCVLKKQTSRRFFFQINTKFKCLILQLHHIDKCSSLQSAAAISLPGKFALLLMEGRLPDAG